MKLPFVDVSGSPHFIALQKSSQLSVSFVKLNFWIPNSEISFWVTYSRTSFPALDGLKKYSPII